MTKQNNIQEEIMIRKNTQKAATYIWYWVSTSLAVEDFVTRAFLPQLAETSIATILELTSKQNVR